MTFYGWLQAQIDRDDPVGDLAVDARNDRAAPKEGGPEQWRTYLAHHPGACRESREALEQAIREYGDDD